MVFQKWVSGKILAKYKGSCHLECFFDAFSESRFILQGKKGLGL